MVANKDITSKTRHISEHAIWCPNAIAQKAAIVALKGPQDCVREMIKEFTERRNLIVNGFSCKMPAGAFYAFLNIKQFGMSSTMLADLLLKEARVATVPGVGFGAWGEVT